MSILFHPYQPFPKPLPPVPNENLGPFCLEIDGKWIPYLLGAISTLAIDQTWESDEFRSTGEARNLLGEFARAVKCAIDNAHGVEMDDCMGCCIRWSEAGILEVFSCGEWVPVPGPGSAISISGPTTPPNPNPPAAGECQNFIGKVRFFGRWLLPVMVSTGDQITVTNADGITTDYIIDFPVWRCPDGDVFVLTGCVTGTEIFNASDPAPAFHHANLIGFDGTNYYDFGLAADSMPVTITIPPGITDQNFVLLINSPGPAGDGDVSFDIKICKQVGSPISVSYSNGSGPAAASNGEIITVTSAPNGGSTAQYINMSFSPCSKITIVGGSGFVPIVGSGDWWDTLDCASVSHGSGATSSGTVLTDFPANSEVTNLQLAGNISSVFTVQIRVNTI